MQQRKPVIALPNDEKEKRCSTVRGARTFFPVQCKYKNKNKKKKNKTQYLTTKM